MKLTVWVLALGLGCTRSRTAAPPRPAAPVVAHAPVVRPPPWLKGQTHVHTDRSGDSHTAPEAVVRWYADRGYDFIVVTDHNVVTRPRTSPRAEMLVLAGAELTWNAPTCGPPDAPCNLHTNVLFAAAPTSDQTLTLAPPERMDRAAIYRYELAEAGRLGGVGQLNHPNFHYGAGAAVITQLAREGLRLVEFQNASLGCQNEGDGTHPDTDALWSAVLTAGVDVWNVASDDAHHYDDAAARSARGEEVYVGERGWVMVRAARSEAAIREALMAGSFYASTGAQVDDIAVTPQGFAVTLPVWLSGARTTFLIEPGRELGHTVGARAFQSFSGVPEGTHWVRAVVDDDHGARAWTQPVRVTREGATVRVRGPFT